MKYRAMSSSGDYQFGRAGLMLVDTPEAVAQAVLTRLRLASGEWFIDLEEGTPYSSKILGFQPSEARDVVFKTRILDTPGVAEITNYYSNLDWNRLFTLTVTLTTLYGTTTFTAQV